jgi:hypothetical protein
MKDHQQQLASIFVLTNVQDWQIYSVSLQPLQRQGSQAQTPPDMKIKAIIQAIVTHPMAGRATLGVSRSQKLQ